MTIDTPFQVFLTDESIDKLKISQTKTIDDQIAWVREDTVHCAMIAFATECIDNNNNMQSLDEYMNCAKKILDETLNSLHNLQKKVLESNKEKPKRCFDAYDNEIFEGDLLKVQKEHVLRKVYKKDDELYFTPYDKEEKVSAYFKEDIVKIVKEWRTL